MSKTIINSDGAGGISTLTVPASSTDREITVWSGTTGTVLGGGHGVLISPAGDIVAAQSVTLTPELANPGSTTTLWVNSANGHLYRGATDVEQGAGLAPGTAKVIPVYDTAGTGITPSSFKLGADTTSLCITESANPARDGLGLNNVIAGYEAGLALPAVSTGNTIIGATAAKALTANNIVAIGNGAMSTRTAALFCTAVGVDALKAGSGASCTGIGFNALSSCTGDSNTAVGRSALFKAATTVSGVNNVAVGVEALSAATSGNDNVAVGYRSGFATTTGANNSALGSISLDALTSGARNTAIGSSALSAMATQSDNVGVGSSAGSTLTVAAGAIAIGSGAMSTRTSGSSSVAIGQDAMKAGTGGTVSIAVGKNALGKADGNYNIGIGENAIYNATTNSSGGYNVAVGRLTMAAATTAAQNIAIGDTTATAITTGSNNVAVGHNSLLGLTTGARNTVLGTTTLNAATNVTDNVALGYNAGNTLTTATGAIAIGSGAMDTRTSGSASVAIGQDAMKAGAGATLIAIGKNALGKGDGTNNIGIGENAIYNAAANSSGSYNVGIGRLTLAAATTAAQNIAIGDSTAISISTGYNNVIVGHNAAMTLTTGLGNTILGATAGGTLNTGSNNVYIGPGVGADTAAESGTTKINTINGTVLKVGGVYNTTPTAGQLTNDNQILVINSDKQILATHPNSPLLLGTCTMVIPNTGAGPTIGGTINAIYEVAFDAASFTSSVSSVFTKAATPDGQRITYNGVQRWIQVQAVICISDTSTGSNWAFGIRMGANNMGPSTIVSTNGSGKIIQATTFGIYLANPGETFSTWIQNQSSSTAATVHKCVLRISQIR